jgi:hypothetical protein
MGHTAHTGDKENIQLLSFDVEGLGPLGKPEHNWVNNSKMNLTKTA